jgi:hypothetical protein
MNAEQDSRPRSTSQVVLIYSAMSVTHFALAV